MTMDDEKFKLLHDQMQATHFASIALLAYSAGMLTFMVRELRSGGHEEEAMRAQAQLHDTLENAKAMKAAYESHEKKFENLTGQ